MNVTRLEERVGHLIRAVEDLSDVVARQDREIALMGRRLAWLMEREARREEAGHEEAEPDAPPPHW